MNVTSILSWDAPHGRHLDSVSSDRVARRQSSCRGAAADGGGAVRVPFVQSTLSQPRAREATCARTHRAISPFHPMHRNTVEKPTTVTQPTCVNTRQFVWTNRRYRTTLSLSEKIIEILCKFRSYLYIANTSFYFYMLLSKPYNNLFSVCII